MSAGSPFDRVLALAAIPELAALPPDALASVANCAQERRWAPGERCSSEGAPAVSFLLSGGVEVGEVGARRVEAPAMIGAVETLAEVALPMRALGPGAHALTVERDALSRLSADVFEVWLAMLRHVAARWLACEDLAAEPCLASTPKLDRAEAGLSIALRILLLRGCGMFGTWRVHALGRLALAMDERALPADEVLWEPGDRASDCVALIEGGLESRADARHGEPFRHEPGAIVGLRELLAGRDRASGLVTSSAARVLCLAGEALIDELEDDPETAAVFLGALAHRTLRAERASSPQEQP